MAPTKKITVRHFTRRPVPGWFSLERLYEDVREALPQAFAVDVVSNRRANQGVVPRILDALRARRKRADVNHILGDVHYLNWFMPRRGSILTIHDCVTLERLKGLRRLAFLLLWYWLPIRKSAYVVVVSHFTLKALRDYLNIADEKVRVIPPPVSRKFVFCQPRPHSDWSRLLHVGSTPNKNLARVVEAISGLNVVLVTIGKLSEEIRRTLHEHSVRYENYTALTEDQLVTVFRASDVLVFPSTYEGWGMPIIEAQATGRPVITSNLASMPEASGGAARLVDPFDVSSIRCGIVDILTNEDYALDLVNQGLKNASLYHAERIAQQYTELYQAAAKLTSPSRPILS